MTEMLEEKFHKRIVDKKDLRTENRCNVCRNLLANKEYCEFFSRKIKEEEQQQDLKGKYLLYYGHMYGQSGN